MMDPKTIRRVVTRWVLFVVCLEIYLRIGGLVSLSIEGYHNQAGLQDRQAFRILCIGESATFIGGKDSYPSQLERILNARKTGETFEVINRGLPGNNSAEIAAHLNEDMELYKPDMVIAMIGINDTERTDIFGEADGKRRIYFGDLRVGRVLKFLWNHVVDKIDDYRQVVDARVLGVAASLAEEKLRREIRIHPKNSGAYIELGQYLVDRKDYTHAAELFRRAIRANPKKDFGYDQLARILILDGRIQEAEEIFLKSLQKNAKRAWAYTSLSRFYKNQNRLPEAEGVLKKGLDRDSGNIDLLIELTAFYREQGDDSQAEATIEQALQRQPCNPRLYKERGLNAASQGRYDQAQEAFGRAAELGKPDVFLDLSDWLLQHREPHRAQAAIEKALAVYPDDTRLLRGLASIDRQTGHDVSAAHYEYKAEELSERRPLKATERNYRTIVGIVQKHGAVMVSVPYATRKTAPLKSMLKDFDGVIFVDNENVFKKALSRGKYEDYFSDAFAGDFGHGTSAGNRLLAETIADAILRERGNYVATP